jgi:hypothetical protein
MAITESGIQTIRSAAERAYSRVTDARVSPILLLALLEDFEKLRMEQGVTRQTLARTCDRIDAMEIGRDLICRECAAAETRYGDAERALIAIRSIITPATAYVETVKQVHQLIDSVLGADGYAAHTHLAPLPYAEIRRALTLIEADEVRCETTLEYGQILRALLADDEQGELFGAQHDA